MSKASPTTYKVGSIGEFAAWTKEMLRNPEAGRDVPRKWFDTEATAARAHTQTAADFEDPGQWQAVYRERIAAAEALLAEVPESQRAMQRRRIAGLKRALTLGPDGLRAAASKAKASRKPTRVQAG